MTEMEQFARLVEEKGVDIVRDRHGFRMPNVDMSFPFVMISLCTGGTARALYNMREYSIKKNDFALTMPGYIMRPLDCSDDYTYAQMAISRKMLDYLRNYLFSHDYGKYHYHPVCSLTDIQAERLLTIVDQLMVISAHRQEELAQRNHILLALMSVGYEYVNYYRREQDKQFGADPQYAVYARFCDLVVEHYRESKEVQFYAEKMHYHPKYLSRIVQSVAHGITPRQWIENYVVAQAKRLIASNPSKPLKHVAYVLGFDESTSFYRYFKRVAGITAKQYHNSIAG